MKRKEERRREEKKMKKHKHRDRSRSRERHREKDKHKKGSMDGFIVDEEEERKKRLKKLGEEKDKAFPSQGLVVTHDNLNGPSAPSASKSVRTMPISRTTCCPTTTRTSTG